MAKKAARKPKKEATTETVALPESQPDNLVVRKGGIRDGVRTTTTYLVFVNGIERWLTAGAINVAIQRQQNVEIPKGSDFIPQEHLRENKNCKGCGK